MSFYLLLHIFLNASELLIVLTIHKTLGYLAKYETHFKIFSRFSTKEDFEKQSINLSYLILTEGC